MGLRFRKSFKIAPGVRVNLGKKSLGMSLGKRGAHVSFNTRGRKAATVGIPGTGLSYTKTLSSGKTNRSSRVIQSKQISNNSSTYRKKGLKFWQAILLIIFYPIGICYFLIWFNLRLIKSCEKPKIIYDVVPRIIPGNLTHLCLNDSRLQHLSQNLSTYIRTMVKQTDDCINLIKSTNNPDVFFSRLNFLLDLFLALSAYDEYFIGSNPTSEYYKMMNNLENTVNEFIDRSFSKKLDDISVLKTAKAKRNNLIKYGAEMLAAFDNPHSFWSGREGQPHYTDLLLTPYNYEKLIKLIESFDYMTF
ncbi:DUF4236 domain-containing protein [Anaerotruncus rubiinfantis]|uniref:DUF4236 domain-containing protein n=1 Tax=Anaerotruncus rubiinfantis TaxID=1720200 RepID=UPI0034A16319